MQVDSSTSVMAQQCRQTVNLPRQIKTTEGGNDCVFTPLSTPPWKGGAVYCIGQHRPTHKTSFCPKGQGLSQLAVQQLLDLVSTIKSSKLKSQDRLTSLVFTDFFPFQTSEGPMQFLTSHFGNLGCYFTLTV